MKSTKSAVAAISDLAQTIKCEHKSVFWRPKFKPIFFLLNWLPPADDDRPRVAEAEPGRVQAERGLVDRPVRAVADDGLPAEADRLRRHAHTGTQFN